MLLGLTLMSCGAGQMPEEAKEASSQVSVAPTQPPASPSEPTNRQGRRDFSEPYPLTRSLVPGRTYWAIYSKVQDVGEDIDVADVDAVRQRWVEGQGVFIRSIDCDAGARRRLRLSPRGSYLVLAHYHEKKWQVEALLDASQGSDPPVARVTVRRCNLAQIVKDEL